MQRADELQDRYNLPELLRLLLTEYGYDFRGYAPASLERRVESFIRKQEIGSIATLMEILTYNPEVVKELVRHITVQVTEMFRDPAFFKRIRAEVLPVLATYPRIKIWHPGCSTGEEVYSMAILLHEADLLHRATLYATDINEDALKKGYAGLLQPETMSANLRNYQQVGCQGDFTTYVDALDDTYQVADVLRRNTLFSFHNLVMDAVFAEVQLIICRNVFIYFTRALQGAVLHKFTTLS